MLDVLWGVVDIHNRDDNNNNNNNNNNNDVSNNDNGDMVQQVLGVCGTCLVLPGWLVLGVTVGTCGVISLCFAHRTEYKSMHGLYLTHPPGWHFSDNLFVS